MMESVATILKEHQELKLVRRRIFRYCSPVILGNLTMDNLSLLSPYIHPMTVTELREYLEKDRMLWYYMFTPDSDIMCLEDAREQAAQKVISLLNSKAMDREEASANKLALEAAKEILARTEIRYEGKAELNPETLRRLLPKKLQGKSIEEIKEMQMGKLRNR